MQKSVKALVLITIICGGSYIAKAQLKFPVINGVAADLKKVVGDYPDEFSHLMGPVITENPQSSEYACNFNFAGAENALFTRYSATGKNICSFEALMLTTESFEKAKQKFRSLCNQVNNLSMSVNGAGSFHLRGKYETPAEEKNFTSVVYSPDRTTDGVKFLKVEISMQSGLMEWIVRLLVYDHDREDNQQGKIKE